ncbi:MAG: sulfite exporter TauE/SafE family protein [Magnetococcales bacterium]|nr:sulfite exporter TauE/SafE family protein [Magnetococcales bacterium]
MTTLSLLTVFLLGISMGLTACSVTCLPFLGTWTLGRGAGSRAALGDLGGFLAGKVFAYTLLGAGAGAMGRWLITTLEGNIGTLAIGGSSLVAGCWLILLANPSIWLTPSRAGTNHHGLCTTLQRIGRLPPAMLGFSLSLIPCVPLASLLAVSVQSESMLIGARYGTAFGLGTAITPLLLIIPLLGFMGREAVQEHPWLARHTQTAAGIVLLVLGIHRLYPGS